MHVCNMCMCVGEQGEMSVLSDRAVTIRCSTYLLLDYCSVTVEHLVVDSCVRGDHVTRVWSEHVCAWVV